MSAGLQQCQAPIQLENLGYFLDYLVDKLKMVWFLNSPLVVFREVKA
jgi:hypothetical protein